MQEKYSICAAPVWGPVPTPPAGTTWEQLMTLALEQARLGWQQGEIPVGALLVRQDGLILSSAHNESISNSDPSAHAEVLALRRAGAAAHNYRLSDCILVVTLEPCMMCTGAIREARLAGVVYGAADLRAGAVASAMDGLDGFSTWHMGGILADNCADILKKFFEPRRMGI